MWTSFERVTPCQLFFKKLQVLVYSQLCLTIPAFEQHPESLKRQKSTRPHDSVRINLCATKTSCWELWCHLHSAAINWRNCLASVCSCLASFPLALFKTWPGFVPALAGQKLDNAPAYRIFPEVVLGNEVYRELCHQRLAHLLVRHPYCYISATPKHIMLTLQWKDLG